eukprot:4511624-Pyramimonas_sp.AAC.1
MSRPSTLEIGPPDRRENEGGGGGKGAPAMAATVHRLGLPAEKLASGRMKGETTCKFVKKGKNCPEAGQ